MGFRKLVLAAAAGGVLASCSSPEEPVEPADVAEPADAVEPATELEEATATEEVEAAALELPDGASPLEIGRAFLAKNGQREGVVTTASGLQYEVLSSGGEGSSPQPMDRVSAHYHGTLIDGRVFDSSVQRGEPLEISVNGVIKGWQEALQLMRVGDKWKLFVPPELAYGENGAGGLIGPNETLVFEVELLAIESA